mmetsp:Transcript_3268/g.8740  ORF Transcript_3268/g.8740 Transcript_3268/m.8740 type:complete len:276 (-) Transcript_3268:219-1046(-)
MELTGVARAILNLESLGFGGVGGGSLALRGRSRGGRGGVRVVPACGHGGGDLLHLRRGHASERIGRRLLRLLRLHSRHRGAHHGHHARPVGSGASRSRGGREESRGSRGGRGRRAGRGRCAVRHGRGGRHAGGAAPGAGGRGRGGCGRGSRVGGAGRPRVAVRVGEGVHAPVPRRHGRRERLLRGGSLLLLLLLRAGLLTLHVRAHLRRDGLLHCRRVPSAARSLGTRARSLHRRGSLHRGEWVVPGHAAGGHRGEHGGVVSRRGTLARAATLAG